MTNSNITIRVEMTNNSGARKLAGASEWHGITVACRHNGGKTVVMVVATDAADAIRTELDEAHDVRSYETQEIQ